MDNVVRLEYAYGVCPKCNRGDYLRYLIRNDGSINKPYEIKCINCNSYFTKEDILGRGEETAPKPITNADRVRGMTDEELADYMPFVGKVNNGCPVMSINCQESCNKCWLDWLRKEVTDG